MGAEENNVPATTAPDHPHRLDLPHYPTFQGVANYPPPHPVIGFPHPVPPPGSADPAPLPPPRPPPYAPRYHTVPGFAVTEGRPARERRPLRCCGLACGWFLFISGFFLVGIPWLVAAICLLCNQHRIGDGEKPGYVASVIAGIIAIIAIVLGVTKGTHAW